MAISRWRKRSNAVIEATIAAAKQQNPAISDTDLRKAASDAYPFGERAYHPYKIWLSAVADWFGPKVKAKPVDDLPMFMSDTHD